MLVTRRSCPAEPSKACRERGGQLSTGDSGEKTKGKKKQVQKGKNKWKA